MEPGLLRVEEAARYLSLGRSKTYQLVAAGELPAIRIGKSVRVPTSALHDWVQRRAAGSAPREVVASGHV